MRIVSKTIRQHLKPACLTATLVTCWQAGQVAVAQPNGGDEVTVQFEGTISPATANLSHMFLVYGTGTSGSTLFPLKIANLGNFEAGQTTSFSIQGTVQYTDFVWWYTAALYGDTSGGQYVEGVNGVNLGITVYDWYGYSWNEYVPFSEATAFNRLFRDTPEDLPPSELYNQGWHINQFSSTSQESAPLYNFSDANPNGEIQINFAVVPEPTSIVFFAAGAMVLAARHGRNGPGCR